MKAILPLMITLCLSASMTAQYNVYTFTGAERPFNLSDFDKYILTGSQDDVLSTWQTLPFDFEFYGQTVTGYYVSDNGYITFDQNATTSYSNNTAIPNTGGPNNAIYAFWDDFFFNGASSTEDIAGSTTLGTAPNRVHVIGWRSVSNHSGGGSYYFSIMLHECGDFSIVHTQGNPIAKGTVGAENASGTVGYQKGNSSNFSFPSISVFDPEDYTFTHFYKSTTVNDLEVTLNEMRTNYATTGDVPIRAKITNKGSSTVNSFDLHYNINGGAIQTYSITGQNITSGSSIKALHNVPWQASAPGHYEIKVWVDNINGGVNDTETCNNEIKLNVAVSGGSSSTRNLLLEEFSGAWCIYCPDGAEKLKNLKQSNPDRYYIVSIHHNDAMTILDGMRQAFDVFAYPNLIVDRFVHSSSTFERIEDRSNWSAVANTRLNTPTPANTSVTYDYDATTRTYTINIQANFTDYAAGDFRMVPIITEDSVIGSGSGYDQANATPLYNGVDPIVGYPHPYVLRAYPAGNMGVSGTIPMKNNPGDTYTETFQYVLPSSYDESKIEILGALVQVDRNSLNREVLNVSKGMLVPTNTAPVFAEISSLTIFPNPVQQGQIINIQLDEVLTNGTVELIDLMGRSIFSEVLRDGSTTQVQLALPSRLTSGVYFFQLRNEKGQLKGRGKLMVH